MRISPFRPSTVSLLTCTADHPMLDPTPTFSPPTSQPPSYPASQPASSNPNDLPISGPFSDGVEMASNSNATSATQQQQQQQWTNQKAKEKEETERLKERLADAGWSLSEVVGDGEVGDERGMFD